jgi:gamma-glutamylcyclotransferase (GGCT)/AIG2-like uncharacterized protein YtfP
VNQHHLFVYGTLLSTFAPSPWLAGHHRVAAYIRGSLYHLPAGYPALALSGQQQVFGELVDPVDQRVLLLLDQYEGVSEGLFERRLVDVTVGLRTMAAWAYVMDNPKHRGGRPVPSGRWRPMGRR